MATKSEALAALDMVPEVPAPSRGWMMRLRGAVARHLEPLAVPCPHGGLVREMTAAVERAGRGERPTPEGVDYSNADTWNEKFALQANPGEPPLSRGTQPTGRKGGRPSRGALRRDPEKGRPDWQPLLQGAGIHHFEEPQPALETWLKSRK